MRSINEKSATRSLRKWCAGDTARFVTRLVRDVTRAGAGYFFLRCSQTKTTPTTSIGIRTDATKPPFMESSQFPRVRLADEALRHNAHSSQAL